MCDVAPVASSSASASTASESSAQSSSADVTSTNTTSTRTEAASASTAGNSTSTAVTQDDTSTAETTRPEVSPPGESCRSFTAAQTSGFSLPIIYRDFIGADQGGHADFESFAESDVLQGAIDVALGQNGPRFVGQSGVGITSATSFDSWFQDDTAFNIHINDTLNLTAGQDSFTYETDRFFPIDDKAQVALEREATRSNQDCGGLADEKHNFSFTSELRLWFDYEGSEVLTFEGDDDVWIFVDNRLIVDFGGVHERVATDPPIVLDELAKDVSESPLGLEPGRRYELAIFQAERRSCGSNYALTLQQFKIVEPNCQ